MRVVYTGADIFDGQQMHVGCGLLVLDGRVVEIFPLDALGNVDQARALDGGVIAPGLVDLQVNGGGGVMFNDDPSVDCLTVMAKAHAALGATSILPTLITDTPDKTRAAIAAVQAAIAQGVAGIAGLHLEGPHLAQSRCGAHDPALIRAMDDTDLAELCDAARHLPVLLVTLAPESVTESQIAHLAAAGAIVSLGHTDAGFLACGRAANSGATCVTHLFNAMRPLGSREPGTVGAALRLGALSAGLIGDLIHVHPETIALALAAKQRPGRIFLVSDAMATAGSDISEFMLNGRCILRRDGRLTLQDGTLAGADLDLPTAMRNLTGIGVGVNQALAMASSVPAGVIGRSGDLGHLGKGRKADFVHLDAALTLRNVWRGGQLVDGG